MNARSEKIDRLTALLLISTFT